MTLFTSFVVFTAVFAVLYIIQIVINTVVFMRVKAMHETMGRVITPRDWMSTPIYKFALEFNLRVNAMLAALVVLLFTDSGSRLALGWVLSVTIFTFLMVAHLCTWKRKGMLNSPFKVNFNIGVLLCAISTVVIAYNISKLL